MTTERDLIQRLANDLEGITEELVIPEYAHTEKERTDASLALVAEARAYLDQPEPEGPTDEEIDALERRHWQLTGVVNESLQQEELFDYRAFLREGLARWGRPAVEPVPVSKRLPGPEDCDTEGRCWWFRGDSPILNAYWDLSKGDSADPVPPTAWLPHYALPVPTTTETP